MWEPGRLTTLWVSTACYRDSITFLYFYLGICLEGLRRMTNTVDISAKIRIVGF
jgi:hypothetical protein